MPRVDSPGVADAIRSTRSCCRDESKKLTPSPTADRRTLIRRAYLDVLGPAADAGRGRRVRQRRVAGRLAEARRLAARLAALRRALGAALDGSRALRRLRRLRVRRRSARRRGATATTWSRRSTRTSRTTSSSANSSPATSIAPDVRRGDDRDRLPAARARSAAAASAVARTRSTIWSATTSLTFMGLTVGCARCHNHKFDPIPQKDYYRIQSVFFSTRGVEHPLVPVARGRARNRAETAAHRRRCSGRCARRRRQIEAPYLQQIVDREIAKLPEYMQVAWKTPPDKRTEGQRLNVDADREDAAERHAARARSPRSDIVALMPADVKAKHAALEGADRGARQAEAAAVPDGAARSASAAATPQPSFFLHRGSPDAPGIADDAGRAVGRQRERVDVPRRRRRTRSRAGAGAASPSGCVAPDNPLTARVMVNRIWQHHFGEGIVRTPSNFGKMGERPSHPELLDWLALEFVDRGWSMKAMHRLMLTSQAYQMASVDIAANVAIDPENRMFWRMPRRAARGGDHPRRDPGRRRHARSHARRPVDLPVHRSRSLRGELAARLAGQAGRRSVDVAAQPVRVSRSAASAIRCSRRSISRTWSTRSIAATARRSRRRR